MHRFARWLNVSPFWLCVNAGLSLASAAFIAVSQCHQTVHLPSDGMPITGLLGYAIGTAFC